MNITAALVKELRERTGSGMMECKKALVETSGDVEAAIELMRKSGLAKAGKKAGRIAAEGCVFMQLTDDGKTGAILEVNCETDFVTKADDFQDFSQTLIQKVCQAQPENLAALMDMPFSDGMTVETARKALIAKIGENINVRRYAIFKAQDAGSLVGGYLHGNNIGVMVELNNGDAALARDIAMHIAASRPEAISEEDISVDLLAKEKEIITAQAADSGKPDEIIEKMVGGRIRKYIAEITLLGQPFVKNPDISVGQLLEAASATILRFERIEVAEGIEKAEEDFAAEVMAQVQGA